MRVHGWCRVCKRIRRVNARDVDVAMAVMRRGVAVGVCDECEEEQRERAVH